MQVVIRAWPGVLGPGWSKCPQQISHRLDLGGLPGRGLVCLSLNLLSASEGNVHCLVLFMVGMAKPDVSTCSNENLQFISRNVCILIKILLLESGAHTSLTCLLFTTLLVLSPCLLSGLLTG